MVELQVGTVFEDSNGNMFMVIDLEDGLYGLWESDYGDSEYTFETLEEIVEMFEANNNPIDYILVKGGN